MVGINRAVAIGHNVGAEEALADFFEWPCHAAAVPLPPKPCNNRSADMQTGSGDADRDRCDARLSKRLARRDTVNRMKTWRATPDG
jgi:hypothetical protein